MKKLIGTILFSVVFMGIYLTTNFETTIVILLVIIATSLFDIQGKMDKND